MEIDVAGLLVVHLTLISHPSLVLPVVVLSPPPLDKQVTSFCRNLLQLNNIYVVLIIIMWVVNSLMVI